MLDCIYYFGFGMFDVLGCFAASVRVSELVQFAERVLDWRACVVSTGILTVSHMIQLSRSTCILVYLFIYFCF